MFTIVSYLSVRFLRNVDGRNFKVDVPTVKVYRNRFLKIIISSLIKKLQ